MPCNVAIIKPGITYKYLQKVFTITICKKLKQCIEHNILHHNQTADLCCYSLRTRV